MKAATIGRRRSKGRHRRQGRWNTFKEELVGDTGDKADGTLVVLGCSHPESKTLGRQKMQPRTKSKAVTEGTNDGLGEKLVA